MVIQMKHIIIYLSLMIIALALSGCSSGIPQEQYDQLTSELTSSQQQLEELDTRVGDLTKENAALENSLNNSTKLNEELSAIAAYSIWFDYYHGTGAYNLDDVAVFNEQLGNLITATGDTNSQAALSVYYEADNAYNEVVDSLPEDNIWTMSQYESWSDAGKSRKEALEQVGVPLLNKLETTRWFTEK